MKIGPIYIHPWNRKNAFWRILVLVIFTAWVTWGLVLYQEGQAIEARLQEAYKDKARKEEIQRRQAVYQQSLKEQRNINAGTGNIMDMLPKEEGEEK